MGQRDAHPLAAVELLIRGFDGRFAAPGNPWIRLGSTSAIG